MTSEVKRPTLLESSTSEEEYLNEIFFVLSCWKSTAESELALLGYSPDWKGDGNPLNMLELFGKADNPRKVYIASDMYRALEYISKAEEYIDNKKFIQAIWCTAKIPSLILTEDADSGWRRRTSARNGEIRKGRYSVYHNEWYRQYLNFKIEKPGKSMNAYVEMIVKDADKKGKKLDRRTVRRAVQKKLDEQLKKGGQTESNAQK